MSSPSKSTTGTRKSIARDGCTEGNEGECAATDAEFMKRPQFLESIVHKNVSTNFEKCNDHENKAFDLQNGV